MHIPLIYLLVSNLEKKSFLEFRYYIEQGRSFLTVRYNELFEPQFSLIFLLVVIYVLMLFLTFSSKKLFFLFNNNHKPTTYNIFGLLSHKNHSYEGALADTKC